ncbi:tetratricopeptide repeat (TPR)-like superfamily protein [Wolffia australiana]
MWASCCSHLHHRPPLVYQSPHLLRASAVSPSKPTSQNRAIQSLCLRGQLRQALLLLDREPAPSQRTFEALILSCARHGDPESSSLSSLVYRRLVHEGLDQDPFLRTRLIEMYSQLGSLSDARHVFDETRDRTIFVWNAILRALAMADCGEEVFPLLRKMGEEGNQPDSFTLTCVLKACVARSSRADLASARVKQVHAFAVRQGLSSRVHVATALVDVYAKLGELALAQAVFEGIPEKNVVSWSAMIGCYARNEMGFEAIELFREMVGCGEAAAPNPVTMVAVLQACGSLAALEQGRAVHGFVLRQRLDGILPVGNALIAMYARCGRLDAARRTFTAIGARRDVVSWNSLIAGCAAHGLGGDALRLFEEMLSAGVQPSSLTFVSLLGACSHGGLVEEGRRIFNSMASKHGVAPQAEHHACMVDMLGRAGELEAAARVVEEMRIEPGPTVWGALLGACRIHSQVELAERACARLFKLEPCNAGNYAVLAGIYAGAGLWPEVARVRKMMEAKALVKLPGRSWIEIGRHALLFVAAEGNSQGDQLQTFVCKLAAEMKSSVGYVPETRAVIYDLREEEKERILLGHSEKLALAFGLINSGPGEVIRITKNLRLCEDCHSFTKFVSKFTKREILVRDVNRFHHFRDGQCSCCDYW